MDGLCGLPEVTRLVSGKRRIRSWLLLIPEMEFITAVQTARAPQSVFTPTFPLRTAS